MDFFRCSGTCIDVSASTPPTDMKFVPKCQFSRVLQYDIEFYNVCCLSSTLACLQSTCNPLHSGGFIGILHIMKHYCAKPLGHCTSCCKPSRQQHSEAAAASAAIALCYARSSYSMSRITTRMYLNGITRNYVTVPKYMCVSYVQYGICSAV